jgi:hypothetical protein
MASFNKPMLVLTALLLALLFVQQTSAACKSGNAQPQLAIYISSNHLAKHVPRLNQTLVLGRKNG